MHDKRLIRTVIIGLAAVCLCAPGAFAKPPHKSDRDRDELRGAVKSVVTAQEVTDTDNDKVSVHEISIGEEDYDLDGNLTLDKTNMTDFVRERTPERIDRRTTAFHSEMGDSVEHYKFDGAGNLIEKAISYGTDPKAPADETRRYKYDKHGRMIEQQLIDRDGKLKSTVIYKRDAKGNIVSQEDRAPDAKPPYPTLTFTYELDNQGNWIKRSQTVNNIPDADAWQYSESQHGPLVRTIGYFEVKPALAKPSSAKHAAAAAKPKPQKPKKQKPKEMAPLETTTITPTIAQ